MRCNRVKNQRALEIERPQKSRDCDQASLHFTDPIFINQVEVNYNFRGAVLQSWERKENFSQEVPLPGWGGGCLHEEISCTDKPRAVSRLLVFCGRNPELVANPRENPYTFFYSKITSAPSKLSSAYTAHLNKQVHC